jgi:hypothetical protein
MSVMQLIFIIIAAISLGGALMVVTTRNLVHAALWLILTLFGVAVLFVLLNAGFLAIVQVVVYIGAIAILMIFAIMLTRQVMGGVDNTRSAKANEELPKEMDKNEVENKLPQIRSGCGLLYFRSSYFLVWFGYYPDGSVLMRQCQLYPLIWIHFNS